MQNIETTTTPADDGFMSTALDFIRVGGHDCDGSVVNVFELMEELQNKFGDWFHLSPEQYDLLELIDWVAADPRVDLTGFQGVEFVWRGETSVCANNKIR
jgi:hypothetical protein